MAKRKQKQQSDVEPEERVWIDPSYERQHERLQGVKGSVHDDTSYREPRPDMHNNRSRYPMVKPEPKPESQVVRLPPPPDETNLQVNITPTVRTIVDMKTSHVDRAKAYLMSISALATVAGIFAVIVVVASWGYPFFSLAVLGYFFTWFAVVWFGSFVLFMVLLAPEFANLVEVFKKWDYLNEVRKDRQNYYGGDEWKRRRK